MKYKYNYVVKLAQRSYVIQLARTDMYSIHFAILYATTKVE
jgi:hypothetical protein